MKARCVIIVLALAFLGEAANAESETFSQTGPWTCQYPDGSPGSQYICPTVPFPKVFGAKPSVTFVNTSISNANASVTFSNITPQGFTPVINRLSKCVPFPRQPHGRTHPGCRPITTVWRGTASGNWIAVGENGPVSGIVSPKYVVLLVAYIPPGTNGGKSTSSVVYEAGSTAGTTTGVSNTFKQSYSIAADSGAGLLGNGGGAGLSFTYARSVTNDQSLEIKKSTNSKITVPGPSVDGIDHDRDLIYLWLNPQINLALTSSSAVWTFAGSDTAEIQYVRVGWLKNPSCSQDAQHPTCMPDDVRQKLKHFGITDADFLDIMQRDVLANGSTTLDAKRFRPLNFTFPYEPPYSQNDPVPTTTFSLSDSSTNTVGSKVTDDYKVELQIHAQGNYLGLVKASLKNTDSWEWTYTSSQSSSTGTSEAATVTIGGPSYGYSGSTDMGVYFDTIYKTFAFSLIESTPVTLQGTLLDANGKPLPAAEVSVIANGIKRRTLTNTRGEWKFHDIMNGACQLMAGANVETLPNCATDKSVEFRAKL
jgi:hypothetical protein